MKVLYFHQHFCTPRGGGGTRSYEMARHLISRGHSVTMVCGSNQRGGTGFDSGFKRGLRRGMIEGIEVIEVDLAYSNTHGLLRRATTFLRFAFRSIWLALTEDHDVVFATSTPLTAAIPGIFARWFKASPFVFEVRDLWPDAPKQMGVITNPLVLGSLSALEYAAYHSATRLVGLAPGIVEGIERRGIRPDLIALIPNGCDLELFGNQTGAWRPAGIPDDHLMAIFTGAHGKANGLDAVIDAARVLEARGRTDIAILLIGDGSEKARLQQRVHDDGIACVHFHDLVSKEKLVGLLASADVGLQLLANIPAFYYGTSPNKFFDYISAGLPVLNNYPGWLSGLIKENDCGFSVLPDDPEAFADALELAADDRAGLQAKGGNALALARSRFARSNLGEQFVDWLETAASLHGSSLKEPGRATRPS